MTITVSRGHSTTAIERKTFVALIENSWQREAKEYLKALEASRISFTKLVSLGRSAEIPYTLFFAPIDVVEAQLKRKQEVLLRGVSKGTFSLNSRGTVHLADIELIVKDMLRKQELLKGLDPDLPDNAFVGALRRSQRTVKGDADWLVTQLGVDRSYLLRVKTKERAFEHFLDCLEERNIFVSQSMRNYMPQPIPKRARFSGICIRDKKVPFLFVNNGDHRDNLEPAGRRLLTLALLTVCLARGKFKPVAYSDQSDDPIDNREYEIAEEMLMPAASVAGLWVSSLDDVKAHANTYCVTPSAFLMRARRLGLLDAATARDYMTILREEFRNRPKAQARQPKPVNALRKYNSAEYSRSLLKQMDANRLPASEITRVLFQNRRSVSLNEYRATL
ncbi:hypothetical protein [Petropleomorpha daqingensis]|uniref:Uncharacterized protein n=1 Tax=Petropleomorpha daqingensis TaxID=2026353 RepID=A0A853CJF0_9ACTN|nr:hypothetical protein [Petropleomorpha daqingensis]NYJ08055.1 hypothetical protein [Petropleomorpha daqingensis]